MFFIYYTGRNDFMYYLQAKEKRRQRKLHLDNKRSKKKNTKSSVQNRCGTHVLTHTDICHFIILFFNFHHSYIYIKNTYIIIIFCYYFNVLM